MIRTNLLLAGDDGYNLTKSLRFRSSASAYLNRTPASASNRTTWTWSGWVKLGALNPSSGWNAIFGAYSDDNNRTFFYTNNNSVSNAFYFFNVTGGTATCTLISTQVLRDPSAWYHLVVSVDTTQGTSTNRVKIYLNGSQITSFGTATYPSSSANFMVNNNVAHYIGASNFSGLSLFHDGYMAEVNFIDGQALTPSSFGSTNSLTGVWQPAKYTGTYGTNGFYLKFTDTTSTSTLGTDYSGNSNTWTVNNISLTTGTTYDSMTDVPTLTSATTANYCVLNPLALGTTTLSNGNLNAVLSTTTSTTYSTLGMDSGKWYWEVTYVATTVNALAIGVNQLGNITTLGGSAGPLGTGGVGYYGFNGNKYVNGTGSAYGSTFTTGDVIGVALDVGGGTVTFYKNNTSQGSITLPTKTSAWNAVFDNGSGAGTQTIAVNFGQQGFKYTPPTGFVALNTYNLPTSTIVKGNTVMDATLYTGNGSTQTITNAAPFKPDLVWIKNRSNALSHCITDSVRGTNLQLASNSTGADQSTTDGLTAFNSNGFSLGAGTQQYSSNTNSQTYVGWQWQAGQGSSSSNTSGSITSTVSVNATAGFSVVTWGGNSTIGATVGHGLGVAPSMIIVKQRTGAESWPVYHISTGATKYTDLDGTAVTATSISRWNNTTPSSSVITLYNDSATNGSGSNYVAYCFAQIAGFSQFGKYTGNNSTDGPFTYTGFRPKFVMIKCSDGGGTSWTMYDSSRNTYNATINQLFANQSAAEGTSYSIDLLSNGFKIRSLTSNLNDSGLTYIYMAFAENPFRNALAR